MTAKSYTRKGHSYTSTNRDSTTLSKLTHDSDRGPKSLKIPMATPPAK
uniref:Uncharacterized protein n=1 Tax=Rhizophora mucronata TaxID=61149 RepID=A0A2P2NMW1_RHIMU